MGKVGQGRAGHGKVIHSMEGGVRKEGRGLIGEWGSRGRYDTMR